MRQAPVNAALPEYARNLIEATAARDDESQHFMAESANLLLTARRGTFTMNLFFYAEVFSPIRHNSF